MKPNGQTSRYLCGGSNDTKTGYKKKDNGLLHDQASTCWHSPIPFRTCSIRFVAPRTTTMMAKTFFWHRFCCCKLCLHSVIALKLTMLSSDWWFPFFLCVRRNQAFPCINTLKFSKSGWTNPTDQILPNTSTAKLWTSHEVDVVSMFFFSFRLHNKNYWVPLANPSWSTLWKCQKTSTCFLRIFLSGFAKACSLPERCMNARNLPWDYYLPDILLNKEPNKNNW